MAADKKFRWDESQQQFVNRVSGEPIPDNEPVIIFRARDIHATKVLEYYLSLVSDPHHRRVVIERINEFEAFKHYNAHAMKEPGITGDMTLESDKRYTGDHCSQCGYAQFETPSGVSCQNGHGGAEPAKPLELP